MQHLEGFLLSPQQRRRWQLIRESHITCAQCLIRIEGPLQMTTLRAALQHIVERHEILRTTFRPQSGFTIPLQVVHDQAQVAWQVLDLAGLPAEQQGRRLVDAKLAERGPFDLEQGPVLRSSACCAVLPICTSWC
jgi:hypothetical protein